MCPIYICPVYIIIEKIRRDFIHTQFTRQVMSLRILRPSLEQWRRRRRRLLLLCVLLSWSLWQLFRDVSELNIDVSFQHAKTSGSGTTNWVFQGVCCLIEPLVNHGLSKEDVKRIRKAFRRCPRKSIRAASNQLQYPLSTVHGVLHKHLQELYQIQVLWELKSSDALATAAYKML